MVLRRSARLDLRAASTMRRSEQYPTLRPDFAMKPSPVKSSSVRALCWLFDKTVTVEPVGEFELKGIRRPMAAYNVLASSSSKPN